MKKVWSPYQEDIFDAIKDGEDDLIVQAYAGSGKTTTIVEGLKHTNQREDVLAVAFNKGIAEELAQRVPRGVTVKTLHALGRQALVDRFGDVKLATKKVSKHMRDFYPNLASETYAGLAKTTALAKNCLVHKAEDIYDLMYDFDINTGLVTPEGLRDDEAEIEWMQHARAVFAKRVEETLLWCRETAEEGIDFDDMVWLPTVLGLKLPERDRVFVDEAQDINPAQVAMIKNALGECGILTSVGDIFQAIYAWRGASDELLKSDAPKLPLPICYRCPTSVVKVVQKVVPTIEPWEKAPEGLVETVEHSRVVEKLVPGDIVIGRTNAALMRLWLQIVKANKPVRVLGRDMAKILDDLVKRSKRETVSELLTWLDSWVVKETKKLKKERRGTSMVEDKAECVRTLAEGLTTVAALRDRIEKVFTENVETDRITLTTVHKFKGKEAPRVFVLLTTFFHIPDNTGQERNCLYVALSRAQRELHLVAAPGDLVRCRLS